ncbi:protein kinase domain-containing protein [Micromonospora humida]|uniref:protein kinase domain-containing protein n=1 Tax=Micromonospora humida TaxID=2809018 RepID=UPI00341C0E40
MSAESDVGRRERERVLVLPFECLKTFPDGINEVRLWWDKYLKVERVGKRIDLSGLERDGSLPEPATLQAIDHPNVVKILAVAKLSEYRPPLDVVELITPFFKRGSITDALLRGENFKLCEAVAVGQKMLLGLSELHDVKRILHRDVKSGNVLLSEDSSLAKVADLGIAAKLDEKGMAPIAQNPTLYAPPEFHTGALTVRSDIYGAGLVVTELIAGAFPYVDYTFNSNIERLDKGLPAIRESDLGLPDYVHRTLRRVVGKAIDRDPSKRYADARSFASALAKAPVVDWEEVDEGRWEAPFRHHPEKRIKVTAAKKRDGAYEMTIRTRSRLTWRKVGSPARVPSPVAPEARRIFDSATELASKR